MKVIFHISKHKNGQSAVEEIICENVASYEFNENEIHVKYNGEPDDHFQLRGNDGIDNTEWFEVGILNTRAFLKLGKSLGGNTVED